jgi:hypothetical protein
VSDERKRCTQCQVLLPTTSFSPCRNGLQSACRACRSSLSKALDYAPAAAEQECRVCRETKPADCFNRCRRKKSGLQSECKACGLQRKREANYPVTMAEKYCQDCGLTLPASEFPRDKKRVGGLRANCRDCAAIENAARLYSIPKELARELRSREQCDLCGVPYKSKSDVNIDHCHDTGAVRGAICTCCNLMLGGARDCPDVLMKAVRYLRGSGAWRKSIGVFSA